MSAQADPVHDKDPVADPLWYKDAVIYQLHIKSFFDSNDDGIGDFPGLIAKLDYIAELGVNTVWLLPFYPSPRRDDGYDIAGYRAVHPDYGNLSDARRFIQAAHVRGIRVITELVINHTSDQHPWFQRARKARPGSAARNFYVWSDTDQSYAGTRIIFLDSEKSNWTWDPVAGAYFWHRFYSHQPDLNFDNPQVLRAVLGIMRFWLDLGVDGLRLDAVPYLVEREGTSNENLPETHAILKQIRSHLDQSFGDRMLLAEANQWPEDAQEYFGNGDECHMSFHFPLMPRMYMAIAKEDRFPIIDILRQTPDIPDNCQWAIFLRNHDELTLEMVTSSERDYLWNTYATDRRARINLGIRRRLATLMERDRRRIELMNSLLFSMPGTPVIYYGDEIGMGDNVYLGDRDGVRTPMQWSPDRNGGFSRADPENLVLPPIMGTLYGYESVNVEAQRRDAHSLLNWTRRMLTMRRQHQAFGRGRMRFIFPGNRKILAYLREYEEETILCVANLSRTPQAVELNLLEFKGRVPVELLGITSFPPIGHLPYLLTLPPYGFYWFQLSTGAEPPSWHGSAPEQMQELTTLVLRNRLGQEFTSSSRVLLEREILPAYLARRRWFASKGTPILAIRFSYVVALPETENLYLVEMEVDVENRTEHYLLPVGLIWQEELSQALPQQLALSRLRRGAQVGFLTDAFALEPFAFALVAALKQASVITMQRGSIRFLPEPELDSLIIDAQTKVVWLSAEQSNSSLVVADHAVLKLVRRIAPGIHPEAEMTRHLSRLNFANTTTLMGEVVRLDPEGTPRTLAVLQRYIANQGDGWSWTLDHLHRTIEDAAMNVQNDGDAVGDLLAYGNFATALGRRLAELHAALARPADDMAFAPEMATRADIEAWAQQATRQVKLAIDVLANAADKHQLDERTLPLARRVLKGQADLLAAPSRLAAAGSITASIEQDGAGILRTRIHGDFHLGQVLVAQGDVYLIDFEGEPAKPLIERRAKTSPLRDVAGLLRSLDYSVGSVQNRMQESGSLPTQELQERRASLLTLFRERAAATFLEAYREVAKNAEYPWSADVVEAPLLKLFLLEKVAYEVCYEAANRPGWLNIPLANLAAMLTRLPDNDEAPLHPVFKSARVEDDHG